MSEPSPFSGYKPYTTYELTIAPNDTHQYRNRHHKTAIGRLDAFTEFYRSMFTKYKLYIEVELNVEVSEVNLGTNPPRLHLHGTLKTLGQETILPLLLHIIPAIQATARIAINDYRQDYWPEYINKQQHIFVDPYKRYAKVTNKDTTIDFQSYGFTQEETESEDEL